jgi:FlaA1/EpsC-like NDP-sugar epimerase
MSIKIDKLTVNQEIKALIFHSRFLVLGGAGTIGQAVIKEIFIHNPKKLHVVDISENNLVELVRDLRSEYGYIDGDFQTFALDIGSPIYDAFIEADGQYDYVLNLSALKHVRSEKDSFTLMRMVEVNILNTIKTIHQSKAKGVKKYFCVSTDKAANPVNMMGASKRIMELFLMRESKDIAISTARFANVAYSDGSLLHGFKMRMEKIQPIVAPNDVRRYFVSKEESGQLCVMSALMGENRDIFFPKLDPETHLVKFSDLAIEFVKSRGYEPYLCDSENEARELAKTLPPEGKWPCYFSQSDTTGEKEFEEFFTEGETLDLERFEFLGIVKSQLQYDDALLNRFLEQIDTLRRRGSWTKESLVELFYELLPEFRHLETGKYLDAKM